MAITEQVPVGEVGLDQRHLFDAGDSRLFAVRTSSQRFETRDQTLPGVLGNSVLGRVVRLNDELDQDICGAREKSAKSDDTKGFAARRDGPRLSPNRKSPRAASASRPVARLVVCRAPLILTNLAGDPSGRRSFNLTFWWEVDCKAPRQPATHSLNIIQSLT